MDIRMYSLNLAHITLHTGYYIVTTVFWACFIVVLKLFKLKYSWNGSNLKLLFYPSFCYTWKVTIDYMFIYIYKLQYLFE